MKHLAHNNYRFHWQLSTELPPKIMLSIQCWKVPDDTNICDFFNLGEIGLQGQILPILISCATGTVWVSREGRIELLECMGSSKQ